MQKGLLNLVLRPSDQENFPKLKKTSRSFKEIAEIAISQIEFLLQRGYLGACLGGDKSDKFLQQQLVERDATIKGLKHELEYVSRQAELSRQMSS